MKHCRTITTTRPASAQLDPIVQMIGIVQSLFALPQTIFGGVQALFSAMSLGLGVLNTASNMFGFELPQKDGTPEA
jgi:hypothetical protein